MSLAIFSYVIRNVIFFVISLDWRILAFVSWLLLKLWYHGTIKRYSLTKSYEGKTVVITSATDGVGKYVTKQLLSNGAFVYILSANLSKAVRVREDLMRNASTSADVEIIECSMDNLWAVQDAADKILSDGREIHVLVNNAGSVRGWFVYPSVELVFSDKESAASGLDPTIAANYYGHFLLTNLLLGRMKRSRSIRPRIVTTTSLCHKYFSDDKVDWKTFEVKPQHANGILGYQMSQLMNVMFTRELSDRVDGTGITANCCHFGIVASHMLPQGMTSTAAHAVLSFMIRFCLFAKTDQEASSPLLYLIDSDAVQNITGHYFEELSMATPKDIALQDSVCEELWRHSQRVCAIK